MRCPKCQYISFDSGDRCRNCGYDFSLTPEVETPDLPIQNGTEPLGPLSELDLRQSSALVDEFASELETSSTAAASRPITSGFDLPLFRDRGKQDTVLVAPNAPPRAPLAVRRATPALPRSRTRRGGAAAEEIGDAEPRLALDTAETSVAAATPAAVENDGAIVTAPILARLAGGLIDLVITAGIDVGVVYFTLQICDLTFAELSMLPLAPLIAFLAVLNGGYFTTFVAAGGQTIGKMATGIRVIPGDPDATATQRVPFGQAIVRAAAYLASALPVGLGFVPALLVGERRALHDRLADTRVVKA